MRTHDLSRDRQAEPGAAGRLVLAAIEAVEQVRQIFPRDALALVRYVHLHEAAFCVARTGRDGPSLRGMAERVVDEVAEQNWVQLTQSQFAPIRISDRLWIVPSWHAAPDPSAINLLLDPGMAFGTGQHHSTSMCLEALEDIFARNDTSGWNVLDVGTGTGILGIAAARLGAEQVLCVDSDETAVEIARSNALLNQVEKKLVITNREVASIHQPFNLIVANLTSNLLIEMCTDLQRLLVPGGYLVISGIIEQNSREIEERFFRLPFRPGPRIKKEEWLCYVFTKE